MNHPAERAAIRDPAFDAFGHQLVGIGLILEITILAALLHRAKRTHAAVALVAAALEQLDFAWAFLGAGEQAADHHAGRAGDQRLADVAGIADAAVGDQRDAVLQGFSHHRDRGDLRHADARHDTGGADRPRANADLDRVRTRVHQRQRGIAGDDVAADHLQFREAPLGPRHAVDHALRMTVRGVHDDHVHARRHQRLDALFGVATDPDRRAHQQAFAAVVGGVRVVQFLLDVLDRDQAAQGELIVHHQHFLDAVPVQQADHFIVGRAFHDRDQTIFLGHDVANRIVELLLEAHVAAGDDANQLARVVDHRHPGDIAGAGQAQHLADGGVRTDGERLADDAGFEGLDPGHFRGLAFDAHVLVQDRDAAKLGHGDGEPRFADSVHRRRDDRQANGERAGELGVERHVLGQDSRMRGNE